MSEALDLIAEHFYLPTGKPYGEVWKPFQESLFRAIFAVRPDGRPVYRLLVDERRRGESKTADTAAAALAGLFTSPVGSIDYACAADEDQARLILDHADHLLHRSNPALRDSLIVGRRTIRHPKRGTELRVISADAPTAYGISPHRVYFDELSLQPDDRLWTAMFSAIGKSPQSQMIAVGMAGWDFASIGWRVRELAASTAAHYFHSREGSTLAPWLSQEDMEEQREVLHPSDFARFWECRWTEPKGSWITKEMYDRADVGQEAEAGVKGFRYIGFVDVGLVHDPTAIAIVHGEEDRVVLDSMTTVQGTRAEPVDMPALEDLIVRLTERYLVSHWMFEAPQAVASVQRLQKRLEGRAQVEFRFPTANTQAELFGNLYRLFSTGKLVLFPHEQLRREALALVIKTVAGRLKVVESSAVHQDHVIALGGAAGLVLNKHERAEMGAIGSINAGLMVPPGGRPAPFGFGITGRRSLTWGRGPDYASTGLAEYNAAKRGMELTDPPSHATGGEVIAITTGHNSPWPEVHDWARQNGYRDSDPELVDRRLRKAGFADAPAIIAALKQTKQAVKEGKLTLPDGKLDSLVGRVRR